MDVAAYLSWHAGRSVSPESFWVIEQLVKGALFASFVAAHASALHPYAWYTHTVALLEREAELAAQPQGASRCFLLLFEILPIEGCCLCRLGLRLLLQPYAWYTHTVALLERQAELAAQPQCD